MVTAVHEEGASTVEVEERTRRIATFYERHAYLVYNVALRITCDAAAALRAAERAFLALDVDADLGVDARAGSVAAAIAAAEAPAEPRTESPLTRALATMPVSQRAALAVAALAAGSTLDLATALGVPERQGVELLTDARRALAAALGVSVTSVGDAYVDAPWESPPDELWQRVYATFHEVQARRSPAVAAGPVATAPAASAATAELAAATGGKRRRGRRRRVAILLLVVLAAVAAGAELLSSPGSGGAPAADDAAEAELAPSEPAEDPAPATADPSDAAARPADIGPNPDAGRGAGPRRPRAIPLSPGELDALRLREIEALKRNERRRADRSLPAPERAEASRQIERIERIARSRLRSAERRERRLREELARERRRRARAEARTEARRRERAAESEARSAPERTPTPQPAKPPRQQSAPPQQEQGCLYNPDDESYVCPEG